MVYLEIDESEFTAAQMTQAVVMFVEGSDANSRVRGRVKRVEVEDITDEDAEATTGNEYEWDD